MPEVDNPPPTGIGLVRSAATGQVSDSNGTYASGLYLVGTGARISGTGQTQALIVGTQIGTAHWLDISGTFSTPEDVSAGSRMVDVSGTITLTVSAGGGFHDYMQISPVVTVGALAHRQSRITGLYISTPVLTFPGGSATYAATLEIAGEPTGATTNYALLVDNGGILSAGDGWIRATGNGSNYPNGIGGAGVELQAGFVQSYNRTTGAYAPLTIASSALTVAAGAFMNSGSIAAFSGYGGGSAGQLSAIETTAAIVNTSTIMPISNRATMQITASTGGAILVGYYGYNVTTVSATKTLDYAALMYLDSATASIAGATLTANATLYLGTPTGGTQVRVLDSASGGYLSTAGVFTSISHEFRPDGQRWKIPTGTLNDATTLLRKLLVRTFDYTDEWIQGEHGNRWKVAEHDRTAHLGLFSGEVQAVSPLLARPQDGGGLNPLAFAAFHTKVLQEFDERLLTLERRAA